MSGKKWKIGRIFGVIDLNTGKVIPSSLLPYRESGCLCPESRRLPTPSMSAARGV